MKKKEIIILLIIVLISLAFLLYNKYRDIDEDELYVSVQVNGEEIKKIYFNDDFIGKKIPIKTEFGYNLIEVSDGSVRVIEADCPDKLDVLQGSISKVGQMIVCLPNKMIIEIKGQSKDKDIDVYVK